MTIDLEHPRPLLRRAWTSLDGPWEFALDHEAKYSSAEAVDFDRSIVVPYAPETPASGVGEEGFVRRVWYRRRLGVPAPSDGSRVLLHFGAVDRIASVSVGGTPIGSHEGGYTPFSFDVTEALAGGGDEVVVMVDDDPHDLEAPRGKQDWELEPHSIWYPRTTGIWRTVWLERVPALRVEGLDVYGDLDEMAVRLDLRLSGEAPSGTEVRVEVRTEGRLLASERSVVLGSSVRRVIAIGEGSFGDRFALAWTPHSPRLLDVEVWVVGCDGEEVDHVESYAALRSVRVDDGRFVLNGRPYFLRLALDQGYWPESGATPPSVEALRRDLELARQLGFNGVRKHQKTEDPRFFAAADALGMLVWAEMPSPYVPSELSAERMLREWAEIVVAHRSHPSVVAWVPVNESWGVHGLAGDEQQRALVRALAGVAGALDPTGRPVSANDGWETVGGDILGIHDYDQDPARLAARYADAGALGRFVRQLRPDGRRAVLDSDAVGGRAPILSEFGGIALGTTEGRAWGYERVLTPDELVSRYAELWRAVRESDVLGGGCWTQLTDTYQEINGLLTADRRPKAPLEELRRATTGRP